LPMSFSFLSLRPSSRRFSLSKSDKPGEEICSTETPITDFLARTWQFGVSKRQYRNSFQPTSMRGCTERMKARFQFASCSNSEDWHVSWAQLLLDIRHRLLALLGKNCQCTGRCSL
jgi:hypothetical protein